MAPTCVYNTAMDTVYGQCGIAGVAGAWFMRTQKPHSQAGPK